jgi:hypothetical protein
VRRLAESPDDPRVESMVEHLAAHLADLHSAEFPDGPLDDCLAGRCSAAPQGDLRAGYLVGPHSAALYFHAPQAD